jgi:hypothetical protein
METHVLATEGLRRVALLGDGKAALVALEAVLLDAGVESIPLGPRRPLAGVEPTRSLESIPLGLSQRSVLAMVGCSEKQS